MIEAQAHPLSGQEILFTRQRHEADRMGLHWDYRFVLGDKAYSWATKKEMPEPGKAIILFEQPVHTAHYALSEKIEIPKGSYGAGTTTLDWVRKAKVEGDEAEPGKLVVNTKDGQRFLLKKMGDGLYGDKAWLFKNLTKYTEGPDSTFTHDGNKYQVDDALRQSESSKVVQVPVSELDWILDPEKSNAKTSPNRLRAADPSFPVLVTDWHGKKVVVDGLHRLTKAKQDGLSHLPTRYVDTGKLEKKANVVKNKYLTKISMGPISGALAVAAGTHFAQNLGMKAALKSNALRQHVANGFSQGLKGVDTSVKAKAGRFVAGAALPEVNALHAASHAAGVKLAPHLNNMSLKEKAGLHALVTGKHSAGVLGLAAKNPKIQEAYSVVQKQHNLRPLHEIEPIVRSSASASKNPLLTNILGGIHKGKNPVGPQFKPGTPSARAGVLGSVASMALEPAAGGVNLAKNLAMSNSFKKTIVGGKISEGLEHVFVKNPFNKGKTHGYSHGKIKDLANDVIMGPINTQLKDLGSEVKRLQKPA